MPTDAPTETPDPTATVAPTETLLPTATAPAAPIATPMITLAAAEDGEPVTIFLLPETGSDRRIDVLAVIVVGVGILICLACRKRLRMALRGLFRHPGGE